MSGRALSRGLSRRAFNASLAAAGGAGLLPRLTAAAPCGPVLFVHDRRLVRNAAAARFAPEGTVRIESYEGDVTALWQTVLAPAWRERRLAVAGWTRHAEYFVLRTLATEAGYGPDAEFARDDDVRWRLVPRTA